MVPTDTPYMLHRMVAAKHAVCHLLEQTTPASSLCSQLCEPNPLWLQLINRASDPLHDKSSNHIGPVPSPKNAAELTLTNECPSC